MTNGTNILDVRVWQIDGARCLMARGDLDFLSVERLLAACIATPSTRSLILDLVCVDYLDSAGARGVLRLQERARALNVPMTVAVAEGSLPHRVLLVLRLDEELDIDLEPAANHRLPARALRGWG